MKHEKPEPYKRDERESERVVNPDLAQEMAEVENEYHKKTFGVFGPSEKKITEGEQAAEGHIVEKGQEVPLDSLPGVVNDVLKKYLTERGNASDRGFLRLDRCIKIDDPHKKDYAMYKILGNISRHDNRGKLTSKAYGIITVETQGDSLLRYDLTEIE